MIGLLNVKIYEANKNRKLEEIIDSMIISNLNLDSDTELMNLFNKIMDKTIYNYYGLHYFMMKIITENAEGYIGIKITEDRKVELVDLREIESIHFI